MQQKVKHRVPSRPTARALRRPGAHQCFHGMNASGSTHLPLFLQFLSLSTWSLHWSQTGKVAFVSLTPTHWLCHVSSGSWRWNATSTGSSDRDSNSKASLSSSSSSSRDAEGLPGEEGSPCFGLS
ncbi:hypothetical protein ACRRTK_021483 [Alexandromys fortis]